MSNVIATQSSDYNTCIAAHAVDGHVYPLTTANDTVLCQTCSVTGNQSPSWLQLDLKKPYLINKIKVYGRDSSGNVELTKSYTLYRLL